MLAAKQEIDMKFLLAYITLWLTYIHIILYTTLACLSLQKLLEGMGHFSLPFFQEL